MEDKLSNSENICSQEACSCDEIKNWRKCVTDRLNDGSAKMKDLETSVKQIQSDTGELVEIFKAVKGGLKVLQALGTIVKWGSTIAVAVGGIVALLQGKWPGK